MTREQKNRLAYAVVSYVGNFGEFWSELADQHELSDIDGADACQTIANWLSKLPTGDFWPMSLPQPTN